MLDNSPGTVPRNLSHTLVKKIQWLNLRLLSDLYYPKHSQWRTFWQLVKSSPPPMNYEPFIFAHMYHPTEPEHITPLSQHKVSCEEEDRQVDRNCEKITSVDKNIKVNTELCVGIIDVLKRCDINRKKQNGDKQPACQWADGGVTVWLSCDVLNMLLFVNYILAATEQSTADKIALFFSTIPFLHFTKHFQQQIRSPTANFPSELSRTRRVDPAGHCHQMSAQRINLLFQNDIFLH